MNKLFTRLAEVPASRREGEHGGAGPILFRRLWNAADFRAPVDFVDYTVIPPGSSIGRHRHEGNEEAYLIVSGSPLMRVQDEQRRLSSGDVAVVHSGQEHELWNDTSGEVKIFVIQVRFSDQPVPLRVEDSKGTSPLSIPDTGQAALHLRADNPVQYRIAHPVRPVFDLEEPALRDFVRTDSVLLVVDENVDRLFGRQIDRYCRRHLHSLGKLVIHAGERHKNWFQVKRICEEAIRRSLPRSGFLVCVGGGTALDTAGLAASLFRRGVRYLRIPTTLVGLVDVGVGVKHGINFAGTKNILGAFYPPFGGVNDLHFLRTVAKREISCGLAEIVKIAMVSDSRLFELLEIHGSQLLASRFQAPREIACEVAVRAEQRMIEELQPNLFERNLRRLVDFGHTFSQAIETASDYMIAHGEAVAIDMLLSTIIAVQMKICDSAVLSRLVRLYRNISLPLTQSVCTTEEFLDSLREARLHRGGNLNLVVPATIGSARFLQEVDPHVLSRAVAHTWELCAAQREPRYASARV